MSVLGKRWLVRNNDPHKATFEKIMENRTARGLKSYAVPQSFYDPFLLPDMDKAVERISSALSAGEKILVFGDYDVDGISGTALLVHLLRQLNANVTPILPNRIEDGYGLSEKFIDRFITEKTDLVITVDCGISCYHQIKKAHASNLDIIITDHHTIPAQPPEHAFAIVHPKLPESKYPFRELTGSGVAFKLAHALIKKHFPPEQEYELLHQFVDLASLGTVADLGPVIDENRLIVKNGLTALENTKWAGLRQILELAEIKDRRLDTGSIGFRIAPRLNAAGRIGDPYIALSLLLQDTGSKDLLTLGNQLESLNHDRQELTAQTFQILDEQFSAAIERNDLPFILIAENSGWHVGVLGLVASRLVEKYARPVILMQDFGDTLVASARSPQYFDITEAITQFGDLLISFGGHAQAAGFNLKKENLTEFREKISEFATTKLQHHELKPLLEIDCEVLPEEIGFPLLDRIEELMPFGVANEKPVLLFKNVQPYFVDQVGREKNHLKFTLNQQHHKFQAIGFNMGQFADAMRAAGDIDLVCNLERNHWNNREYIQLHILDFKPSESVL